MIRVPTAPSSEVSRRRATVVTVACLFAAAAIAPHESLDLVTSVVGVASAVAIAAGFGPRGTLSLKPWVLTTCGVASYAGAALLVDSERTGLFLNMAGLVALTGAVSAVYTQRSLASINDRVEVQHRRHAHRNRWGAALVAVGVAVTVLSLRVAAVDWSSEAVANETGGTDPAFSRAPYLPARVVGRIESSKISEASGLVASRRVHALWVHNDSGHGPWLYCVQETGSLCGRWYVTGAGAVDWEDIAADRRNLYIGDIGDNAATRSHVTVYVVGEPNLKNRRSPTGHSAPARAIQLRYPDGARDAEAMLVHPFTGDLYVMSKGTASVVSVYKAEHPLEPNETLVKVGTNRLVGLLVDRTAMDIARDGRRVVIATYGGIYELTQRAGETFDQIWDNAPKIVEENVTGQVEAVAYARDGAILFTEEAEHPRLWKSERL